MAVSPGTQALGPSLPSPSLLPPCSSSVSRSPEVKPAHLGPLLHLPNILCSWEASLSGLNLICYEMGTIKMMSETLSFQIK